MKKRICGVYQIINMLTGDCYIGSSKDVWTRISNHRCYSKFLQCPNSKLYKAYQEYDKKVFFYTVLEECTPEMLKATEQKWIEIMKPAYNTRCAYKMPKTKKSRKAKKAC